MNRQLIAAACILLLTLPAGCGPSEREVELNDEISALTTQRDEVRAKLDAVSAELEELESTPVGRLCSARLVVSADGVAEAEDAALEQADGLYAQLIADYPEEAFVEEAAATHTAIREERCLRALAPFEGFAEGIKSAADEELEKTETELSSIGSTYDDTDAVRRVDKLLAAIEREWDRRGTLVSASAFVANQAKYAGEVIRIPGQLHFFPDLYLVEFSLENTDKSIQWSTMELGRIQELRDDDLAAYNHFLFDLCAEEAKGEVVISVSSNGMFQVKRLLIGNEEFNF